MSRKHKVRPPVQGHPDRRMNPAGKRAEHPDPVTRAVMQAAEELFIERGGERKQRMLKLFEGTMEVYEQDLERAKGNEEGFRWRVRPNELMRLRREIDIVEAEIEKLREECYQIASQLTGHMLQQSEQARERQATPQMPEARPFERAPEVAKEVAATQPTGTAQRAAG